MQEQTYNQAILELAQAGLAALNESNAESKTVKTPAAESHFLCHWMASSLKSRRFSKLVADDLSHWIRQARSIGAAAELKLTLEKITQQYTHIANHQQGLGQSLNALFSQLVSQDWVVILDAVIDKKLKLSSDGSNSLIISADHYEQRIQGDELLKPVTLYVRANETEFAKLAYAHNLIVSPGDKKASLIKHHKAYIVRPKNQLNKLAILQPLN